MRYVLRPAELPGSLSRNVEDIRETTRTLELKLGWPQFLSAHFEKELRAHFDEA
jgi:hypothetical protein